MKKFEISRNFKNWAVAIGVREKIFKRLEKYFSEKKDQLIFHGWRFFDNFINTLRLD